MTAEKNPLAVVYFFPQQNSNDMCNINKALNQHKVRCRTAKGQALATAMADRKNLFPFLQAVGAVAA